MLGRSGCPLPQHLGLGVQAVMRLNDVLPRGWSHGRSPNKPAAAAQSDATPTHELRASPPPPRERPVAPLAATPASVRPGAAAKMWDPHRVRVGRSSSRPETASPSAPSDDNLVPEGLVDVRRRFNCSLDAIVAILARSSEFGKMLDSAAAAGESDAVPFPDVVRYLQAACRSHVRSSDAEVDAAVDGLRAALAESGNRAVHRELRKGCGNGGDGEPLELVEVFNLVVECCSDDAARLFRTTGNFRQKQCRNCRNLNPEFNLPFEETVRFVSDRDFLAAVAALPPLALATVGLDLCVVGFLVELEMEELVPVMVREEIDWQALGLLGVEELVEVGISRSDADLVVSAYASLDDISKKPEWDRTLGNTSVASVIRTHEEHAAMSCAECHSPRACRVKLKLGVLSKILVVNIARSGVEWKRLHIERVLKFVGLGSGLLRLMDAFVPRKRSRRGGKKWKNYVPDIYRRLFAVAVFRNNHFTAFVRASDASDDWTYHDGRVAKVVGPFSRVVSLCAEGSLVPCLLFYD